jgi:hypothetical protein
LDCEFIKVHGHQASNQKDLIDRLFTIVDRASRKALRKNSGDTIHNSVPSPEEINSN